MGVGCYFGIMVLAVVGLLHCARPCVGWRPDPDDRQRSDGGGGPTGCRNSHLIGHAIRALRENRRNSRMANSRRQPNAGRACVAGSEILFEKHTIAFLCTTF